MKKILILLTTIILISVNGYANTKGDITEKHHDQMEQTESLETDIVMFTHCQTVNLGSALSHFPPLTMQWEIGGPVFVMAYEIRFKPAESGMKMIITCDLVKKQ